MLDNINKSLDYNLKINSKILNMNLINKSKFLISCLFVLFSSSSTLYAQYSGVQYNNTNTPELVIKQIDNYDFSTVVHFSYTTISSLSLSGSEDIVLVQNGKNYKLINSFNLPLDNKKHMFNDTGDQLNFSLEFEKLDSISQTFVIGSRSASKFNIDQIRIDTSQCTNFKDVDSFVGETPSREYFVFYHEGYPVLKYSYKGIILAVKLLVKNEYGIYFQPQIIVQNYNNKDFLFDPSKIYAQFEYQGKYYNAKVFSDKEYMKIVRRKMSSDRFWSGLADGLAAVGAGYSYISGSSNTYVTATGKSLNYGFFGNNMYSSVGSSSVTARASTTYSGSGFNGMNTFIASQVARQNMDNLKAQQVEKLNVLQGGYLKLNTIFPNSEYTGYTNISFAKGFDNFLMKIELNNEEFFFEWDKEMVLKLMD